MADLLSENWFITKEHYTQKYIPNREDYGKVKGADALKDKVVALYFSASWCPPCQQFTPLLKELYNELLRREAPLQIVFVSFDKTKEDMEKYYTEKQGNWLAVEFVDPLREQLSSKYSISSVPKLVIIRQDGEVITMKGRKDVQDKGIICFRNWLSGANLRDTGSKLTAHQEPPPETIENPE